MLWEDYNRSSFWRDHYGAEGFTISGKRTEDTKIHHLFIYFCVFLYPKVLMKYSGLFYFRKEDE